MPLYSSFGLVWIVFLDIDRFVESDKRDVQNSNAIIIKKFTYVVVCLVWCTPYVLGDENGNKNTYGH